MASNKKWYLELAHKEHGDRSNATTYGPFLSKEDADKYLSNFSNPGGMFIDDSGKEKPPTKSPDGSAVVYPKSSGRSIFGRLNLGGM